MRYLSILSIELFIVLLCNSSVRYDGDEIVGEWLTKNKSAVVSIFREEDKFYGQIGWLERAIDPDTGGPQLDVKNPDKLKRTRKVLGLIVMEGFTFNADKEIWENGKIYNALTGKTYKGHIEMVSHNILKLRGYVGVPIAGRTDYWVRVRKE